MSPVRAFLMLLAVLVSAGVVLWVTTRPERSEPIRIENSQAEENGATSKPEPARADRPTKAEARNIFKELDQARIRAYRRRTLEAIPTIWTQGSPVRAIVKREIHRLRRDTVLMRTDFQTKKLTITDLGPARIRLTQIVVIDPRFVSETGEEVTVGQSRDQDTVRWLLLKKNGRWLIHNATVVARKKLHGEHQE